MPTQGDWLGLLDPLRAFFAALPAELAHQPQVESLTAAVEDYLLQQRGLGSVQWVDRLDKKIEWFYRVDLEGTGQLEAFEVRYVDWEGSTLPDGQLVLWDVAEHTVDRWALHSARSSAERQGCPNTLMPRGVDRAVQVATGPLVGNKHPRQIAPAGTEEGPAYFQVCK